MTAPAYASSGRVGRDAVTGETVRRTAGEIRFARGGVRALVASAVQDVHREARDVLDASGLTVAAVARSTKFPVAVLRAFFDDHKVLLGSFTLARLLRTCGAPESTVTRLHADMTNIEGGKEKPGLLIWNPAELELSEVELRFTTAMELADVLRHIVKVRSGLSTLQVAKQAAVPRSQLYNLLDGTRNALPRGRAQLHMLLRTCMLGEQQIRLVLRQWDRLDHARTAANQRRGSAAAEPTPSPVFHDDFTDEFDDVDDAVVDVPEQAGPRWLDGRRRVSGVVPPGLWQHTPGIVMPLVSVVAFTAASWIGPSGTGVTSAGVPVPFTGFGSLLVPLMAALVGATAVAWWRACHPMARNPSRVSGGSLAD